MSTENKIKLSIKGAGLSYESEIDQNTAGQVMALCLTSDNLPKNSPVSALSVNTKPHSLVKESAAEYLYRHSPQRNPDKILALAGYLKEFHNKEAFQPGEIKSLFRDAGELMPANITRDFKTVVSSGWIAPDHFKKGSYYITNTGMKVLQAGFPDEMVSKSKHKSSNRRKKALTTT
jgi:hypothetical protein